MIDSTICLSRYVCCIFFFVISISFGKTKQKVIALVATAIKIMLAVAKTNVRLSGREFYAGNIDNLFWNNHTQNLLTNKKCANRSQRTKTQTPIVAKPINAKKV
jgi:ABC-type transport system involved in cytochrome c biogenesis permease component